MRKGIIYCALFPNNKKYYGKTVKSLKQRIIEHLRCEDDINVVFHKALKKYKNNVIWNIIEEYEYENKKDLVVKLNEQEKYWIKKDKTYIKEYGTKFGYNLTQGGDGGDTRSGTKQSEETKEKIRNSLLGVKHSEERKLNQSIAHKGQIAWNKGMKKIK